MTDHSSAPDFETRLPDGWSEVGGDESRTLERELQWELSLEHPLRSAHARARARDMASDDVLFSFDDPGRPFAVVHLTWRPESSAGWPWFRAFHSLDRFFATWTERE